LNENKNQNNDEKPAHDVGNKGLHVKNIFKSVFKVSEEKRLFYR